MPGFIIICLLNVLLLMDDIFFRNIRPCLMTLRRCLTTKVVNFPPAQWSTDEEIEFACIDMSSSSPI